MTYILSKDDRDSDPVKAFRLYKGYIQSKQDNLPKSVYELATSDWYYNFNDHKCPHDAWLESALIYEPSQGERQEIRTTQITVKLLGAYHDGHIEIKYKNVKSAIIKAFAVKSGHHDWRYDEFRLSENGLFLHEIEWCALEDTANWIIEAEDMEFFWSEST